MKDKNTSNRIYAEYVMEEISKRTSKLKMNIMGFSTYEHNKVTYQIWCDTLSADPFHLLAMEKVLIESYMCAIGVWGSEMYEVGMRFRFSVNSSIYYMCSNLYEREHMDLMQCEKLLLHLNKLEKQLSVFSLIKSPSKLKEKPEHYHFIKSNDSSVGFNLNNLYFNDHIDKYMYSYNVPGTHKTTYIEEGSLLNLFDRLEQIKQLEHIKEMFN